MQAILIHIELPFDYFFLEVSSQLIAVFIIFSTPVEETFFLNLKILKWYLCNIIYSS